jgi:peptide/nickel transport system substrate-binding protein
LRVSDLPRGTVTFLYTDIEGSTLLLRQLGRDRYDEALNAHHHILESAVAAHEGRVVDTQGDSFFVAFGTAAEAIAAAVDAQRELAAHTWPEGKAVKVRMGLHTGEPKVGAERYVGVGVHRAARIGAAGHGGQVLVSQATRELLRDDPLPHISLRDLGEHQLKDIEAPERIFQLVAPGLGEAFPPLKTAASTSFEGREDELAEAAAEQMAARWRRPGRRTLILATFGAAVVGVVAGVLLTQGGGSTASASVRANSVGVFDPRSGDRAAEVPVGASPGGVAVSSGASWVTKTNADTVLRINAGSNTPIPIRVGVGPVGVAVGDGSVWVANGSDGTVSRINVAASRVVGDPIPVGNGPVGIAFDAARKKVWVANSVDGTVSEIDAASGKVRGPFPATPGVTGVVVAFDRVWVVSPSTGTVVSLYPGSGQIADRVSSLVDPVAIAAGDGAIWVANRDGGKVAKILPRSPGQAQLNDLVSVGPGPISVAVVRGGVWVANGADGTLMRIDPSKDEVVKTVVLGNPPQALAGTDQQLYVAVRSSEMEHRGGTLHVRQTAPGTLDPAAGITPWAFSILAMTNDGLVGLHRVGGIEGVQLVPNLAKTLPIPSDDGLTYTFHLRSGIHYSTGKLVQAADFRAAIERTLEFEGPAGYFGDIEGAAACRDGHACDLRRGIGADNATGTVTFHLTRPDGDFLAKLTLPGADALPAGTPPPGTKHLKLPATGPYAIRKYDKDHSLLLVRNPQFRQWSADAQPNGYPDRIVFSFRPFGVDQWPDIQLIENGRADIAPDLGLSHEQFETLQTSYPLQLQVTPNQGTEWFFLNTHVPPFDKLEVRRAVNEAFDRRKYVKQTLGHANAPSCQILPPDFPGYRRRRCLPAAVSAAKRLVSRAGEARAKVILWMPAPGAAEGQFMVSVLNSIGLRAQLKLISLGPKGDIGKYFGPIGKPKNRVQIGYNQWFPDFPSEGGILPPLFSCQIPNPSEFCDHAVDHRFAKAEEAQLQNPARAPALWQKAERAILAQAPNVPTDSQNNAAFLAKRVRNFQYEPGVGVLLDQLWLK